MSGQTASEQPLLELRQLVAGYLPGVDILNRVDLALYPEEIIGIIGPNGAGKSTLLKALFGLLDVRSGEVLFKGESITGLRAHELVARGVGYVPQLNNVFSALTVMENLEMGVYLEPRKTTERLEKGGGSVSPVGGAAWSASRTFVGRGAANAGYGAGR